MKTVKIFSSFLALCCAILLSAQSIDRQVIGSTGASSSTSTIQMDYTVGEAVIGTFGSSSITVTQGFHQTLVAGIGVSDLDVNSDLIVYPNPTNSILNIQLGNTQSSEDYNISVVSLMGVKVLEMDNSSVSDLDQTLVLDVSDLASSSYLLLISNTKTGECNHFIFEVVH
jgi:hypothetical protein